MKAKTCVITASGRRVCGRKVAAPSGSTPSTGLVRGAGFHAFRHGPTTILYRNEAGEGVKIDSVRTPEGSERKGAGRAAMVAFLGHTDAAGLRVTLDASPLTLETKLGPLVAFYRSLGFVETGRAANWLGHPEMTRPAHG